MQTKNKPMILAVVSLALLITFTVGTKPLIAQLRSRTQQTASVTLWLTEEWTGDEKPYEMVRKNIDDAFSHGKLTAAYLNDLEVAWHQDEHDPARLFRWSYAHYRSRGLHPPIGPLTIFPSDLFKDVTSPHTYQYTRVRFLVVTSFGTHPELMELGKRLLAHTPNDFDVEYSLSTCFPQYLSASEKEAALAYATRLIQKYPDKPNVYAAKGGIYFSYWMDHRNKQDAQAAIKWYKQYLRLAPANYEWRKEAQSTISLLQTWQY